ARERRGLDAGAGAVAVCGSCDLDLLAGRRRLAAALALLLTRGARGTFFLRRLLDCLSRPAADRRDVFSLFADHGDRRADVRLAFGDGDLEQDAGSLGLDLLGDLVGVELVERLALLHVIAFGLQPFDDRPRLHPLPEAGELYLVSHAHS